MIKFDSQEKFSYESYHLMKKNKTIIFAYANNLILKENTFIFL